MVQTRSQTAKALVSQQRHETETTPIYEEATLTNYLREKQVEDLLKNIVVELCKSTPDNVLEFIVEHISKQIAHNTQGATTAVESLSTDVTGDTLGCHLESTKGTLENDETVSMTPKGARCSRTGDPIGAQRTTTCSQYDELDEQLAREIAIHGPCHYWSDTDEFSLDGKQCGEECPCCRAESYRKGTDMYGWIGACVLCLPPSILPKCHGCLEDEPNQMAHFGPNGCLGEELY